MLPDWELSRHILGSLLVAFRLCWHLQPEPRATDLAFASKSCSRTRSPAVGIRAGHEPAAGAAEEAAAGERPLWLTPTRRADRRLRLCHPPPSAASHVVSHSHQATVFREWGGGGRKNICESEKNSVDWQVLLASMSKQEREAAGDFLGDAR